MLTKLTIRNFKQFDEASIELGNPVVFIGPNNSGKTTALQALALWNLGLSKWIEKRGLGEGGKSTQKKRTGVAINRKDLISTPIPDVKLLWRELKVRRAQKRGDETQKTENIRVEISVEGVSGNRLWEHGLEFDYANEESLYVRPLSSLSSLDNVVLNNAREMDVVFLPPMSGLTATELRLDPGAIAVRIGEGRTADVLRNLCLRVSDDHPDKWKELVAELEKLFGCMILPPEYIPERGEITMSYRDLSGTKLDLSCSGRGFQQTLLLLSHMAARRNTVLLLDEPDAHLEILRQRSLYQLLVNQARKTNCQLIVASHSEVVLNEAGDQDVVVAFVGNPHRIDDRGTQLTKSLKEVGFDQYYLAKQRKWVLYLEGSTDLAILRSLAMRLEHRALVHLEEPFVHYIANNPHAAANHYFALREAQKNILGFIICDRQEKEFQNDIIPHHFWSRRELENYICQPETLVRWAEAQGLNESAGELFANRETNHFREIMENLVKERVPPIALNDPDQSFWINTKASDDFLDPLFEAFTQNVGLPRGHFRKSDYHQLAAYVNIRDISPEIVDVLDQIHEVAVRATSEG